MWLRQQLVRLRVRRGGLRLTRIAGWGWCGTGAGGVRGVRRVRVGLCGVWSSDLVHGGGGSVVAGVAGRGPVTWGSGWPWLKRWGHQPADGRADPEVAEDAADEELGVDEHDPVPACFLSGPMLRRLMAEGEATDQVVAGILDWAETTDSDRDDLDRWLRRLVTRRGILSPAESASAHRVRPVADRWTSPAVDHVDSGDYCCGSRSEVS